MDVLLFDEVAETLRTLLPPELDDIKIRARRYGLKAWFGKETAPREHYEAQVIGAKHVKAAKVLALEVGFHAEHNDVVRNDEALARIGKGAKTWKKALGAEVEAGPFIGRPDDWRRVSETWADPDLSDPEIAFEIAARLADYITELEPLRRA